MADNYNIYKRCTICKGTGRVTNYGGSDTDPDPIPPEEVDCTHCDGAGEILWGQMREEEIE